MLQDFEMLEDFKQIDPNEVGYDENFFENLQTIEQDTKNQITNALNTYSENLEKQEQ